MSVLGRSSAHGHSLAGAMAYLALWQRQRSQPVPGSVVARASSVVTAATRRGHCRLADHRGGAQCVGRAPVR
jgi:hypothetical protein